MNRPLLAVALSTFALAACSQKQEAAPPSMPAPAAAAEAPAPVVPAVETPAPATPDAARPADASTPAPGEPRLQPK